MKKKLSSMFKRRPKRAKEPETRMDQAIESLPRITNETVAEHREEMLGSARKFIYPLAQSRRTVVITSSVLLVLMIGAFFTYTILSLYKFQSASGFMYRVTQVLPFPVAKAGGRYVAYENYLFQLRHYIHYYQTQQDVDFVNSSSGRDQLANFRKQALQQVIDNAYIKQLAAQNNVTVSEKEVDDAVNLLRQQNRLGNSDQELADVLKEFWNWNIDDFRRELREQLLAQKLVAKLDTDAATRAQQHLSQLNSGTDFLALAKQVNDAAAAQPGPTPATPKDTAQAVAPRDTAGEYAFAIDRNNRDLPPQLLDQINKLKVGETSGIINTGTSLEIIKVLSNEGGKVRAAHISSNFKPISAYLGPAEKANPAHAYITLK